MPDPTTRYRDLPGDRERFSYPGNLWHLLESGLLDDDAPLTFHGHYEAKGGAMCLWHALPACHEQLGGLGSDLTLPARAALDQLVDGRRVAPCLCVQESSYLDLSPAEAKALAWLSLTDPLPTRVGRLALTVSSLRCKPALADVDPRLTDRVTRRAALRASQVHAAPSDPAVQYDRCHDLTSEILSSRPSAWMPNLRTLPGFADASDAELAARYVEPATRWRAAWNASMLAREKALDGDDVPDSAPTARSLVEPTWRQWADVQVWVHDGGLPFSAKVPAFLGFATAFDPDLTVALVPAVALALDRSWPRWLVLGEDRGYRPDVVARAAPLVGGEGDVEFNDMVEALTAALT